LPAQLLASLCGTVIGEEVCRSVDAIGELLAGFRLFLHLNSVASLRMEIFNEQAQFINSSLVSFTRRIQTTVLFGFSISTTYFVKVPKIKRKKKKEREKQKQKTSEVINEGTSAISFSATTPIIPWLERTIGKPPNCRDSK
jgi:hypothetical protein